MSEIKHQRSLYGCPTIARDFCIIIHLFTDRSDDVLYKILKIYFNLFGLSVHRSGSLINLI